MKLKQFIYIVLFLALSCTSQKDTYNFLKNEGYFEKTPDIKYIKYQSKSIAIINLKHIGTKEYYDSIERIIDSLQYGTYVFLIEGIKIGEDSLEYINKLKYRKLLGIAQNLNQKNTAYIDTVKNKIFGEIPYNPEWKLINQPDLKRRILKENQINIDTSLNDLIKEYEMSFGEIELSNCDKHIEFGKKYYCKGVSSEKRNIFIQRFLLDYRSQLVTDFLKNTEFVNLVILYGAAHSSKIKEILLNEKVTND